MVNINTANSSICQQMVGDSVALLTPTLGSLCRGLRGEQGGRGAMIMLICKCDTDHSVGRTAVVGCSHGC
jgi:hypothetical protein